MQLNKRFFVCTNNNTSNIEFTTFNSWISSVDQCILQDFSSLPYDCKFAEFFSVSSIKKKKNTNRFHVAVKCGKNENRWHTIRIRLCHKRWIDVLCYSLLNRLTAKWNLLVLCNERKEKLQTCRAPLDCSRLDVIQVTNATFPPFVFSSLFNC